MTLTGAGVRPRRYVNSSTLIWRRQRSLSTTTGRCERRLLPAPSRKVIDQPARLSNPSSASTRWPIERVAAHLAVGDHIEPGGLLQRNGLVNGTVLDALELGRRDVAPLERSRAPSRSSGGRSRLPITSLRGFMFLSSFSALGAHPQALLARGLGSASLPSGRSLGPQALFLHPFFMCRRTDASDRKVKTSAAAITAKKEALPEYSSAHGPA